MGIKLEKVNNGGKREKSSFSELFQKEITLFGSSFSIKVKEQFYAELGVLLNSGISLKTALDLIAEMQKKQKHRLLIEGLANEIIKGSSLASAMQKNTSFSSYEFQAVKIGEQTGQLPQIANDLRGFFHRKTELRRQLISSLSYPFIVLVTACLVVFFMLRYVVPMFVDIFKQNQVELPWLTQVIVNLSNFVIQDGIWLLLGLVILIICLKVISKKKWYYRLIGKIQLTLPVLGNYLKKIYLIQFTQAMALLTHAKIPVVNGVAMVRDMIHFHPLEKTLYEIEKDIITGTKLNEAFQKHPFYDKKIIALLKVAEETNQTEYIFQKLYDQYSTETKYQGQIISNVLNFLLTLFVGIIVGVILIAMYLPMFKLSSVIG